MNKKYLSTIMISLLLLLGTQVLAGPNLTISEPDFDFGYVPQQAKISHDFWLYSTGDSVLIIEKVVPG